MKKIKNNFKPYIELLGESKPGFFVFNIYSLNMYQKKKANMRQKSHFLFTLKSNKKSWHGRLCTLTLECVCKKKQDCTFFYQTSGIFSFVKLAENTVLILSKTTFIFKNLFWFPQRKWTKKVAFWKTCKVMHNVSLDSVALETKAKFLLI